MDPFGVPLLSDAALDASTGSLAHQKDDPVYVLDVRVNRIKHEAVTAVNTPLDSVGNPNDLIEIEVSLPLWLVDALEQSGNASLAITELLAPLKGLEYSPSWVMVIKSQFTL